LGDTSITRIGGVFKTDSNQYVDFVAVDLDPPYRQNNYWGYILLDSVFNVKQTVRKIYNIAANTLFNIIRMQVKRGLNGLGYYG